MFHYITFPGEANNKTNILLLRWNHAVSSLLITIDKRSGENVELTVHPIILLIKIKLGSIKSSEHFHEKRDGPYRGFGYLSLFSDPSDLATWSQRELL